jgi:hypothetical protein
MSTLYQVRFTGAEEMPQDPKYIDARRFDFHFSYGPLDSVEKAEESTLLVRVVVPGREAIELDQNLEKILYWLAAKKKNLRAYIERQATGLQLVELKTIPSYPDPSTIEYPPKDPLIVEIDRKIGFKP